MVWGPVVSALVLLDFLNMAPAQFVPVPPIMVPSSGDVWKVGELRTVEWGIKDEPLNDSSGNPYLGFLLLSYDSGDPENPVVLGNGGQKLASDFPISQRIVNMIVPEVPTRKDYKIFMNADFDGVSWSGPFEILNSDDPQGTGLPATSISVASAPPVSVTVMLPTTIDSSDSSSTTIPATSTTSSSSDVSTSQSAQTGVCPLSRNDLMTRAGLILVPALAVVLAIQ